MFASETFLTLLPHLHEHPSLLLQMSAPLRKSKEENSNLQLISNSLIYFVMWYTLNHIVKKKLTLAS